MHDDLVLQLSFLGRLFLGGRCCWGSFLFGVAINMCGGLP
jgi:hypothetical protein